MRYPNITPAKFLVRSNRFVATVLLQGREEQVHVKNTGRCRELLRPGVTVWLTRSENPARKYAYDLVSVEKNGLTVNLDSQAPNRVFYEFLKGGGLCPGITRIQPEYVYGGSRVDFYLERDAQRHLVEVKGVTLEQEGVCRFPDAPTLRGTRHLEELIRATQQGIQSWFCFVVQMEGMRCVLPNRETDPAFAETLHRAEQSGVNLRAFGCRVAPDTLEICEELPVLFD